jgi:hypothetical protein
VHCYVKFEESGIFACNNALPVQKRKSFIFDQLFMIIIRIRKAPLSYFKILFQYSSLPTNGHSSTPFSHFNLTPQLGNFGCNLILVH